MTKAELEAEIELLCADNKVLEKEVAELRDEVEELEERDVEWLQVRPRASMLIGADIDNLNELIRDYCEQHNISIVEGN